MWFIKIGFNKHTIIKNIKNYYLRKLQKIIEKNCSYIYRHLDIFLLISLILLIGFTTFLLKLRNPSFAIYIAFGLFFSQYYNIHIYKSMGASNLNTWFNNFSLTHKLPRIKPVKIACALYSFILFLLIASQINKITNLNTILILKIGFLVSLFICAISQLIFSSIMRFTYELSFCLIVLFAILIHKLFLGFELTDYDFVRLSYKELWDLLIFIIPICIGFPIVIGGAGFISSFYSEERVILKKQLYRHISMSGYFEVGAIYFIIIPILEKIISSKQYFMNN